jgi:hypothetical protein
MSTLTPLQQLRIAETHDVIERNLDFIGTTACGLGVVPQLVSTNNFRSWLMRAVFQLVGTIVQGIDIVSRLN